MEAVKVPVGALFISGDIWIITVQEVRVTGMSYVEDRDMIEQPVCGERSKPSQRQRMI